MSVRADAATPVPAHQPGEDDRGPAAPPRHPRRARNRSVARSLWWFVVPGLVFYLFVLIVPSVQGVVYSFTDWRFTREPQFVGLENYIRIFHGEEGSAVWRTLYIAFVVVVVQNLLGLGLALLLNGRVFGRNLLRTIIFAPMVVSTLVVGYLFKYIFGPPGSGGINQILAALGQPQVDFLGNPSIALTVIIITIVWQFTGSTMVIYLAGLQAVPPELEEAAALDGAGYWKRFWFIVRPLLAPAITINLMLGLIGGLKLFDQIFAITGGGPGGQTETISTLLFKMFSIFGYYGEAMALAVLLALAVGVLSFIQFSVLRRQERNT